MSSNYIQMGHVFIHKDDRVSDYPQSIFTDPKTFTPYKTEVRVEGAQAEEKEDVNKKYCIKRWGLKDQSTDPDPLPSEGDVYATFMMQNQNKTVSMYKEYPTPDVQFIKLLAKIRKDTLQSAEVQELCKAIYRIRIMIKGAEDLCYRVFTVPASTHLNVLHDQIIVPIMGFCRGSCTMIVHYT